MSKDKTYIGKFKTGSGFKDIQVVAENYHKARAKMLKEAGFEGLSELGNKRGRKRKYGRSK